jgi:protein arginine kinase activator
MCETCPQYVRHLHGMTQDTPAVKLEGALACGNCQTTLDSVRMGNQVGCSVCYEVFAETLFHEMQLAGKIPARLDKFQKSYPLHIGRAPGTLKEATPLMKFVALNEALSDTLKAENYEQAAVLRDQIKELTEKNPELKEKTENE